MFGLPKTYSLIRFLKKNIGIVVLSLSIVIFYKNLLNTFYQQDEWHGLGDIIVYGINSLRLNQNIFQILVGEGRIFANALVYFLLGKFPFNIAPVAMFAILFQVINSILVYIISLKFLKKKITSLFVTAFFAFSGVSHSAVTWAASSTGTLPATTLILLSLLSFFRYLDIGKRINLFSIFLLIYFSLYFKEIGIFLFIFYPLTYWFIKKSKPFEILKKFWSFLVFSFISGGYRIFSLKAVSTQKDLFLTDSTRDYFSTLVLRTILYPLTTFSQNFIPHKYVFQMAKQIVWNYYEFFSSELYDLLAQSVVLDAMSLLFTGIIICLFIYLFINSPNNRKEKIIFWLVFSLMSVLPYVLVGKTGSYLESRYYYLSVFSAAILLGYLLERIPEKHGLSVRIVSLTFVLFAFLLNVKFLRDEIARQEFLAHERLNILNKMVDINKRIDQNEIVYVSGDRNFYITEGNPLPLQQGTGYTILTWYYIKGLAPQGAKSLIGEYYLWEMNGQGFRKVDNFLYGFYWDLEKLKEDVINYGLNINSISGFYYDSSSQETKDISQKVRDEIEKGQNI